MDTKPEGTTLPLRLRPFPVLLCPAFLFLASFWPLPRPSSSPSTPCRTRALPIHVCKPRIQNEYDLKNYNHNREAETTQIRIILYFASKSSDHHRFIRKQASPQTNDGTIKYAIKKTWRIYTRIRSFILSNLEYNRGTSLADKRKAESSPAKQGLNTQNRLHHSTEL